MNEIKVKKKDDQKPTNEIRRQAAALIRGFARIQQADRYEMTVALGGSQFQIVIDKRIA